MGSHPASGREPGLAQEMGEQVRTAHGCQEPKGPGGSGNEGSEPRNSGLPAPSASSIRVPTRWGQPEPRRQRSSPHPALPGGCVHEPPPVYGDNLAESRTMKGDHSILGSGKGWSTVHTPFSQGLLFGEEARAAKVTVLGHLAKGTQGDTFREPTDLTIGRNEPPWTLQLQRTSHTPLVIPSP